MSKLQARLTASLLPACAPRKTNYFGMFIVPDAAGSLLIEFHLVSDGLINKAFQFTEANPGCGLCDFINLAYIGLHRTFNNR